MEILPRFDSILYHGYLHFMPTFPLNMTILPILLIKLIFFEWKVSHISCCPTFWAHEIARGGNLPYHDFVHIFVDFWKWVNSDRYVGVFCCNDPLKNLMNEPIWTSIIVSYRLSLINSIKHYSSTQLYKCIDRTSLPFVVCVLFKGFAWKRKFDIARGGNLSFHVFVYIFVDFQEIASYNFSPSTLKRYRCSHWGKQLDYRSRSR